MEPKKSLKDTLKKVQVDLSELDQAPTEDQTTVKVKKARGKRLNIFKDIKIEQKLQNKDFIAAMKEELAESDLKTVLKAL